jgi:suppressor of G2 allele of SKP1
VYVKQWQLFDAVDAKSAHIRFSAYKLIVKMAKRTPDVMWDFLEKSSAQLAAAHSDRKNTVIKRENQYESSAADQRALETARWDALGKQVAKEEAEDKPEGEEALNALFKKLYAQGDDATKAAMKKSYQLSGGTVLSTNWGDVKKTNYEDNIQAPKGQVCMWCVWIHACVCVFFCMCVYGFILHACVRACVVRGTHTLVWKREFFCRNRWFVAFVFIRMRL